MTGATSGMGRAISESLASSGADVVVTGRDPGRGEEVVRVLPSLAESNVPIIAVTAKPSSTLGRAATAVLD